MELTAGTGECTAPPSSSSSARLTVNRRGTVRYLSDVIEDIGMGPAQLRAGLLGGGVWFADGAELLLISTVTKALSDEWSLTEYERASVVTVVFIGIFVGNLISGPIGDSFGRLQLIVASYFGIFVFSILSSCVNDLKTLAVIRFFVGASFGIGQPSWTGMSQEITPKNWRVAMNFTTQGFFILGEMYSASLVYRDDPNMQNLHWRWLLRCGAIPSAVFGVLSLLLLNQSPMYLASQGRSDSARAVLEDLRRTNGADGVSLDFTLQANIDTQDDGRLSAMRQRMGIIFGGKYLRTTLILLYACFVMNLMFYGCMYAFPQVLARVETDSTPGMQLITGALYELPSVVLGITLGMTIPRKPTLKLCSVMNAASLLMYCAGANMFSPAWLYKALKRGGYLGIKCFGSIEFMMTYQYAAEVFPTEARITGVAVVAAGGRLAGIMAPLLFEFMQKMSGGFEGFFCLIAVSCVILVPLTEMLPMETAGANLDEPMHEENNVKDSSAGILEKGYGALGASTRL